MPGYINQNTPTTAYQYLGVIPTDIHGEAVNYFPDFAPVFTRFPHMPVGSPSFKIINDSFRPASTTLNNAGATGTGTTVTVVDASMFDYHDVIQMENEYALVVGVNTSTNVLTLSRGFAGTTNATHPDLGVVYLITNVRTGAEVDIPALSKIPVVTEQWVQTIMHAYSVGGQLLDTTALVSGYANQLAGDKYRCAAECIRDVEKAIYYGKVKSNGSSTDTAAMAGFQQLLTTNNTTSPANAGSYKPPDFIRDTVQKIYAAGGRPTHMFVSAEFLAAFSTWKMTPMYLDAGSSVYNFDIQTMKFPFTGEVKIIPAPLLRPYTAFVVSADEVAIRVQRNLTDKPRGSRGDAVEGDLIMRAALSVANESHHAWVQGITAFAAP